MPKDNEKTFKSVFDGMENFTSDFHTTLAGETTGNFVNSALSARTVLAMAAYGADGSTGKAMRKTLHLPADDSQAHQGFQRFFIDTFNNVPNVTLQIANKIYAADDLTIKHEYHKITDKYFLSECEKKDFKRNVESAKSINKWCDEKTKGNIQEILTPEDIDETMRMVLLNAVYFKGYWYYPFDPKNTTLKPFYVDKNNIIEVPTMFLQKNFFYEKLEKFNVEVVRIPYVMDDLFLEIIVPMEIDGLAKVEENFKDLKCKLMDSYTRRVNLFLPKFKIESTHDLESHLSKLGMSEIFSTHANFNGICDEKVRVSKIIQKAFFEVNEEDSEAAAITRNMRANLYARMTPPPPINLTVDRPFLFKIMYKNTTLLSGRIQNPL